jgi:hypothetical protein
MIRVLVLALCCAWPADTSHHGTALAALRDKNEVAIAADSRVLDRLGMRVADACKVRVVDDTVIAVHGLALDDVAEFDLFAIAAESLAPRADLGAAVRTIGSRATGPLTRALARVLSEDPLMLQAPGLKTNPAGVVLARFERGAPRLGYVRFSMRLGASGTVTVTPQSRLCPGDCPTGIGAILVSPDSAAEARFEAGHPDCWQHDLVPQAVGFVQTQIQGPFNDVGPPIDAIRIAKGQISWVARKDGCREKE